MRMFDQAVLRGGPSSGQTRMLALRACLASLAIALAASGGVITTPALAAGASPGAGPITFFGDVGNDFGSGEPFLRDASYFLVRPSSLLLTEDGSVDLENLRWSGWGTPVARATGVWTATISDPWGMRTKSPAGLTLSSPGTVLGHLVYRCFRIDPPHPQRDILDQGCLHRQGTYEGHDHYGYQ